jgi:hypothetical protein
MDCVRQEKNQTTDQRMDKPGQTKKQEERGQWAPGVPPSPWSGCAGTLWEINRPQWANERGLWWFVGRCSLPFTGFPCAHRKNNDACNKQPGHIVQSLRTVHLFLVHTVEISFCS